MLFTNYFGDAKTVVSWDYLQRKKLNNTYKYLPIFLLLL